MARLLGAAALALVAAGCGQSVTVTMRSDTVYEGKPITNDATRLVIETDEERLVLCKRNIRDVDHPGDVAAIAGLVSIPLGVAFALLVIGRPRGESILPEVSAVGLAAPGVVLAAGGGRRWFESKEATGWPPEAEALDAPCTQYASGRTDREGRQTLPSE